MYIYHILYILSVAPHTDAALMSHYFDVTIIVSGIMEELHSLDPRRQELLEARFMGGVSGSTGGSTGSTSGGTKVSQKVSSSSLYFIDQLLLLYPSALPLKKKKKKKCFFFSLQVLTNNESSNHSFGSLGSLSDKESEVLHSPFLVFSIEPKTLPEL